MDSSGGIVGASFRKGSCPAAGAVILPALLESQSYQEMTFPGNRLYVKPEFALGHDFDITRRRVCRGTRVGTCNRHCTFQPTLCTRLKHRRPGMPG